MSELTVGFVGLGNMGWPMAANLHAAGFALIVRDADADRQARFAVDHPGVTVAAAPGDLAPAEIVVTMLPDGSVVADALLSWGIGAATYCATAEAVLAGARFGLDPRVMIDIINASTGRSFNSVSVWGENVLTGAYATGFALGLMAKDVRIAQSVIAAAAADAPVLAVAHERWAAALGELGPAADQSRAHQAWWADDLAPGSSAD